MTLEGAVNAVRIGAALQESWITGKKIEFDENGLRIWDRGITRARINLRDCSHTETKTKRTK
jgi:hypothetical protein